MNARRLQAVVGLVVLIALLAGCMPAPAAPAPTQAPAAPAATPTRSKVLLGFANMVEGYEFATQTRTGIVNEAQKLGWDTLLLNNNFDANTALTNARLGLTPGASTNGDVIWTCGTATFATGTVATAATTAGTTSGLPGKYLPSSCR
jgi:hypothetical protein